MIRVGKVRAKREGSAARLYCDYELDGDSNQLWFEVGDEFSEYVSRECGDAFFVPLVLLAHLRGQDITFSTPISSRLHYGVVYALLPALRIVLPGTRVIRVFAETSDFQFEPTAVGTALSLGVDSFHAVAQSIDGPYPVSHLALFNSGAFGELGGERSRVLFRQTASAVAKAALEMDLPLILVDSNMSEVVQCSFQLTHSIRNLSFALLFPRLFKIFYYASGYPVTQFQLKSKEDATRYDLLMSVALHTESLEVMIAGLFDDRITKISTIASFYPALHHLNVCFLSESNPFLSASENNVGNCSRCFKCVKTLVALDVLGKLDSFSSVFDLDVYESQRDFNLGWMLYDAKKLRSVHAIEILREGFDKPDFITAPAYGHALKRGLENGLRKLRRTMRRSS